MSYSIRLITEETTLYYPDPTGKYLISQDKAFLFFRPKGKVLLVGFLQHVSSKETSMPAIVKEAIANDLGIVYICDKLPDDVIVHPNIVYIKVQWAWLIHTLFFNPLQFKGVFGNAKTLRIADAFHKFTQYNIPVVYSVNDVKDMKAQVIAATHNLLFEILGGVGDHLLSIPALKTLYDKGNKINLLINKHRHPCLENLPYINKVYYRKDEINTADFDNIYWLNFGQVLNDYSKELNQQNRIYSVANLCSVDSNELTRDIPEIVLSPSEEAYGKSLVVETPKNIFFGFDSARADSRMPVPLAQSIIDKLHSYGFTVYTTSVRQMELKNCINLTAKLSIRQLFSLIKAVDAVLTIDTAFLHIAGAFEKPTYALINYFNPEWRTSTYKNCKSYEPTVSCRRCAGGQYVPVVERQCRGGNTCFYHFDWDKILQDVQEGHTNA